MLLTQCCFKQPSVLGVDLGLLDGIHLQLQAAWRPGKRFVPSRRYPHLLDGLHILLQAAQHPGSRSGPSRRYPLVASSSLASWEEVWDFQTVSTCSFKQLSILGGGLGLLDGMHLQLQAAQRPGRKFGPSRRYPLVASSSLASWEEVWPFQTVSTCSFKQPSVLAGAVVLQKFCSAS